MIDLDLPIAVAGLLVGFTVGLTGMGGGALMTPVLVLVFGVQPLTAVSSDLVVSLFMKPVGGAVHMREGTVNKAIVKWLVIGSVPTAFLGVLVLKALGDGEQVQQVVKVALGLALLLASAGIVLRTYQKMRAHAESRRALAAGEPLAPRPVLRVRPIPTMLIGAGGGFVVGMTSVGSGSLIIVLLLLTYPMMTSSQVVGTDLVQAVPLVASAALGHLLFGDVELGLTASLLVGALPGVYVGARLSSRAPQSLIRRALVFVLVASGLKLVGLSTEVTFGVLLVLAVLGPVLWIRARRALGLPGFRAPGWPSLGGERDRRRFFAALATGPEDDDAPSTTSGAGFTGRDDGRGDG